MLRAGVRLGLTGRLGPLKQPASPEEDEQEGDSIARHLCRVRDLSPAPHQPPVLESFSYQTAFLKQSINSLLH